MDDIDDTQSELTRAIYDVFIFAPEIAPVASIIHLLSSTSYDHFFYNLTFLLLR